MMSQSQGTPQANSSTDNRILHMAMELSNGTWKLALSDGVSQPSVHSLEARDRAGVMARIEQAKRRFKLGDEVRVVSCYEAGRDGFWIDRWLKSEGIENLVVDSSSIEVSRRKRRAKTDGLDVRKLLVLLIRYVGGEEETWAVLRIPTEEEEDGRRLHRELERLKNEHTQHTNRIRSLLALQGIRVGGTIGVRGWEEQLEALRCWDGRELPPGLKAELVRESERLQTVREQIRGIEREQREAVDEPEEEAKKKVAKLMLLCGIGMQSSWLFVHEMFGWRAFRNGREVGSYAGLTGTPYNSGESEREQGISKAGNRRVRRMIVEIAWCWLRFQPESELSIWYQRRFGGGSKRMRRIGIVALSRKLLVQLWRYVELGEVPPGAVLATQKPA
jgi:transposase